MSELSEQITQGIGWSQPTVDTLIVGNAPSGAGLWVTDSDFPPELLSRYPDIAAALILYFSANKYVYLIIGASKFALGTWDGSFIFELMNIAGPNSNIDFNGDTVLFDAQSRFINTVDFITQAYISSGLVNNPAIMHVGNWGNFEIDQQGPIAPAGEWKIDGKSGPRGVILHERYSGAPFSSTTAATTEQVMATTASKLYKKGRAFRAFWYGAADSATAMTIQPRIRVGSLAGANVASGPTLDTRAASADTAFNRDNVFANNSGADITTSLVLTFANGAAAVSNMTGSGSGANTLIVEDIGAATDFPNATNM